MSADRIPTEVEEPKSFIALKTTNLYCALVLYFGNSQLQYKRRVLNLRESAKICG
jgi:hypothetical protein